MIHFFLCAVLIALTPVVRGAKFTSPAAPDTVWAIGETQVISWEADVEDVWIYLWQQWPEGNGADMIAVVYSNVDAHSRVSQFEWLVTIFDADLDYSNEFFFWFNQDSKEAATSTYFNITRRDEAATSTTATTTGTATGTATLTPSASSNPDSSDSTSLTSTDKIALGVGIGIGVPILAALCALIWLKARKPTPKDEGTPSPSHAHSGSPPHFPPAELEYPAAPAPKEVPADSPYDNYAELPAQQERSQQGQQGQQGHDIRPIN